MFTSSWPNSAGVGQIWGGFARFRVTRPLSTMSRMLDRCRGQFRVTLANVERLGVSKFGQSRDNFGQVRATATAVWGNVCRFQVLATLAEAPQGGGPRPTETHRRRQKEAAPLPPPPANMGAMPCQREPRSRHRPRRHHTPAACHPSRAQCRPHTARGLGACAGFRTHTPRERVPRRAPSTIHGDRRPTIAAIATASGDGETDRGDDRGRTRGR